MPILARATSPFSLSNQSFAFTREASSRPNTATDPCAGASRPCAVIMPEAMVDGETITEEEASAPGWIDAIRPRAKSSTTTTGKPAGARIGRPANRSCDEGCSRQPTPPAPNRSPPCHRPPLEVTWIRRRNNNQQTQGDSATQQPTPKQPSPTPPTEHLPTTKYPTVTPTWADRVTGKGGTRGYAWSGNLPQHKNDEIRELKRELALLRK
ncbi:hypothetical protein MRX96_042925 [Rhipicephalus microplus]